MLQDLYASNPKLGNMMLGAYNRGGLTGLLGQYGIGAGSKWQPKPKPGQETAQPVAPMAPEMPTYNPTMYQPPTFNPAMQNNFASFLAAGQSPMMQNPYVNPAEMYRKFNIGNAPQIQYPDYMPYKPRQPRQSDTMYTRPMLNDYGNAPNNQMSMQDMYLSLANNFPSSQPTKPMRVYDNLPTKPMQLMDY
jgi:hypothetical protein